MQKQIKYKYRESIIRGKKIVIDYLPDDIFYSLNEGERRNYREYRRSNFNLGESNLKLEKLNRRLEKLKSQIKEVKGEISERKDKVNVHFSRIGFLSKDIRFNISIYFKDKTSESYYQRKKQKENPNHSLNEYYNRKKYLKKFYKGKPLTKKKKFYISLETLDYKRKNIYVGSEKDVRLFLNEIVYKDFDRDIFKDSLQFIKDELREVYSDYITYMVRKIGWNEFLDISSNNINVVRDWYEKTDGGMNKVTWDTIGPNS